MAPLDLIVSDDITFGLAKTALSVIMGDATSRTAQRSACRIISSRRRLATHPPLRKAIMAPVR
jgi:hypothetical protein